MRLKTGKGNLALLWRKCTNDELVRQSDLVQDEGYEIPLHLSATGLGTARMVGFIYRSHSMMRNKCAIPVRRLGLKSWGNVNAGDLSISIF